MIVMEIPGTGKDDLDVSLGFENVGRGKKERLSAVDSCFLSTSRFC